MMQIPFSNATDHCIQPAIGAQTFLLGLISTPSFCCCEFQTFSHQMTTNDYT